MKLTDADIAQMWKARAEAAEAERDEALTALGEHVIATERDRDKYLALQRVIVERDNENEALRARLAKCAETHAIGELLKSDALMVLTVYDAHVLPENRGEWRDRLLAWASPAALVEPVGEPPRQSYNENPTVTRLTAPGGVGDLQPPTCATCGGERFVCDLGIAAGSNECAHPDCTENRRPCPSCAPTEPGDAT